MRRMVSLVYSNTVPRSPLILVVEDYVDAREMYRDYLTFAGFRVETAADGYEALEKARELRPDLILMDLALPVLDGWEATRRLRADPATADLKIVALSAHALATEGRRAKEAGCDGFIAKPCLPQELAEEISRILAITPNRQRAGRRGRRTR
jgi:CheY-like chemotaxis protein